MTLWKTGSGDMTSDQDNDGSGVGMAHIEETEPGIVQAAAHGIFGLEPRFGDNLMRIRPNLPSHWDRAAISNPDVGYSLKVTERNDGRPGLKYTVNVTFASTAREVQLELNVRGAVAEALVDGATSTQYTLEGDKVNGERVRLRSATAAVAHKFEVIVDYPPQVHGSVNVSVNVPATFTLSGAGCFITKVLDPQAKLDAVQVAPTRVELIPIDPAGLTTVFLQLRCGSSQWLHPLDLHVQEHPNWDVQSVVVPPFRGGAASEQCSAATDPTMQGPACWTAIATPTPTCTGAAQ